MKKILLISLLLLTGIYTATYSQMIFGVKGGLNLATVAGDDVEGAESKIGFHVGPTLEMPLSDMLSFETGLLVSTKGFKAKETFQEGEISVEVEATNSPMYLDIPLTAKANLGSMFHISAGPYLGIGIGGKMKAEGSAMGIELSETEDIEWGDEGMKRLDYGIIAGAGVNVGPAIVGVFYQLGLADLAEDVSMKNRVLGISVGIKFGGE